MKMIKYFMNDGGSAVSLDWSEANEEIAKKEAFNGEYTIEECEPLESLESLEPTTEERLAALESAMLEMILGGMTE